jgi:hypothetical protein
MGAARLPSTRLLLQLLLAALASSQLLRHERDHSSSDATDAHFASPPAAARGLQEPPFPPNFSASGPRFGHARARDADAAFGPEGMAMLAGGRKPFLPWFGDGGGAAGHVAPFPPHGPGAAPGTAPPPRKPGDARAKARERQAQARRQSFLCTSPTVRVVAKGADLRQRTLHFRVDGKFM